MILVLESADEWSRDEVASHLRESTRAPVHRDKVEEWVRGQHRDHDIIKAISNIIPEGSLIILNGSLPDRLCSNEGAWDLDGGLVDDHQAVLDSWAQTLKGRKGGIVQLVTEPMLAMDTVTTSGVRWAEVYMERMSACLNRCEELDIPVLDVDIRTMDNEEAAAYIASKWLGGYQESFDFK